MYIYVLFVFKMNPLNWLWKDYCKKKTKQTVQLKRSIKDVYVQLNNSH